MKVRGDRWALLPRHIDRRRRNIPRRRAQRLWNPILVEKPTVRLPLLFTTRRWPRSREVRIERWHCVATPRIITSAVTTTWPPSFTGPGSGTRKAQGQVQRGLCSGRFRTSVRLRTRHPVSRRTERFHEILGDATRGEKLGLRDRTSRRSCTLFLRGARYAIKGAIRTWPWRGTWTATTTSNDEQIECRPTRRRSNPPDRGRGRPLIGLKFGRSVCV